MSKRSYTKADKIHALKILELCEGNVSAAARETGIPRVTILGWLKERENQFKELELSDCPTSDGPLTDRQKRFADEYARTGNARASALSAGYAESTASVDVYGKSMLENPRVQARIQARLLAAQSLLPDEVKGTLTQQMRADLDDFVNDAGYFSLDECRKNGVTALLKRLDYDELGSVKKFEVYSAQSAAKDLARILGMTQPKGTQVNQINVVYVNDWRGQRLVSAESASGPADSDESGPPI